MLATMLIVFAIYYHLIIVLEKLLYIVFHMYSIWFILHICSFQLPHKASCSANNCPIWAMLVSGAAVVCREKSERDCCFDFENAVLDSIEDENPQIMAQLLYSALNLEVGKTNINCCISKFYHPNPPSCKDRRPAVT